MHNILNDYRCFCIVTSKKLCKFTKKTCAYTKSSYVFVNEVLSKKLYNSHMTVNPSPNKSVELLLTSRTKTQRDGYVQS